MARKNIQDISITLISRVQISLSLQKSSQKCEGFFCSKLTLTIEIQYITEIKKRNVSGLFFKYTTKLNLNNCCQKTQKTPNFDTFSSTFVTPF